MRTFTWWQIWYLYLYVSTGSLQNAPQKIENTTKGEGEATQQSSCLYPTKVISLFLLSHSTARLPSLVTRLRTAVWLWEDKQVHTPVFCLQPCNYLFSAWLPCDDSSLIKRWNEEILTVMNPAVLELMTEDRREQNLWPVSLIKWIVM